MNNKELESILMCPMTHTELSWLNEDDLSRLNQRILDEDIACETDLLRLIPLSAALKVLGHDIYYPVINDIIFLLPDQALMGNTKYRHMIDSSGQTKKSVKHFYDDFGWQAVEGVFQDAKDSEDLRAVSQEYILRCHMRLNQHLPHQGKYLLDIASGPIQYEAYLSYSSNYDYRICADISLKALIEAKKKLGPKGIYLLCDVTQLPIQSNVIDAIVSLHTLYHVPKEQQATAFSELHRALKPNGVSAIVYSWGHHSILMNVLMFPFKAVYWLKRKLNTEISEQTLYFYAHNHQWFNQEIKSKYATELYSWRSVNVPFLKIFIHQQLGGKYLLKAFYFLENRFPHLMGKLGAYPLLVSRKNSYEA